MNATEGLVFNGSQAYTINQNLTYGGVTPGVDENAVTVFWESKHVNYVKNAGIFTIGLSGSAIADNGLTIQGGSIAIDYLIRTQLKTASNTTNNNVRTNGNVTLNENAFYKFTLTQSSSSNGTGTTKLYVDGILVDSTTQYFLSGQRNQIHFGSRKDNNFHFIGSLTKIAIWNRELTESEVLEL